METRLGNHLNPCLIYFEGKKKSWKFLISHSLDERLIKNNIPVICDAVFDLSLRYLWNYYLYFPFFFSYYLICGKNNERNYIGKSSL